MNILIGSGFSELLDEDILLSRKCDLGNDYQIHKRINSEQFFHDLKKMRINVPIFSYTFPTKDNWLIKKFSSFGGNEVKSLYKKTLKNTEYYQKLIDGEHVSVHFIANEKKIRILAICNQIFEENKTKPFIIKGIITKKYNLIFLKKINKICEKIKRLYNLKGINNLDIIIQKKTLDIFVIELNARPGLSTNLLYRIHKDMFKDSIFKKKDKVINHFYSTQILYSKKIISINKKKLELLNSLRNSKLFSELPSNIQTISPNKPICLIHSQSKKKQILRENIKKISYKILNILY